MRVSIGDLVKKKRIWRCVEYNPHMEDSGVGLVVGFESSYANQEQDWIKVMFVNLGTSQWVKVKDCELVSES